MRGAHRKRQTTSHNNGSQAMSYRGYFIDWNGQVRCTDDPGHGYCCEVDSVARRVTVINKRGITMHEATLYRSLDAIEDAESASEFVTGSYPWLTRAIGRSRTGTRRQRTPLWLHQLRDRCTHGAMSVYALFRPEVLAQTARFSHNGKHSLLDDLAHAVGMGQDIANQWSATYHHPAEPPETLAKLRRNARSGSDRH